MSENVKNYSALCSKIGFAMLIFYSAFTLSAIAVTFISTFFEALNIGFVWEVVSEAISAIAYFLSFSGAAFILCFTVKKLPTAQKIYTSFKPNVKIVYVVFAIIAVNFALSYLNSVMISSISPTFGFESDIESEMSGRPTFEIFVLFIMSTISTAIVPAICEEYLFRGAILTNLTPFGNSTAILGSALLFGLMHQNPFQLLYTTLMGIVIGYVYVKTKSIWVCMIIHFANNFTTVLEEYLPILTGVEWITIALDLLIMLIGVISLMILIFTRDKEPSIEEKGSFEVIYERGINVEEYELDIPREKKIKHFFSATVIIFVAICLFDMAKIILSIFDITIF